MRLIKQASKEIPRYLEADYVLPQLSRHRYEGRASVFLHHKKSRLLDDAIKVATGRDNIQAREEINLMSYAIDDTYHEGGTSYLIGIGLGLSVLRGMSSESSDRVIHYTDWLLTMKRNKILRAQAGQVSLAGLAAAGLSEVKTVNPVYVSGLGDYVRTSGSAPLEAYISLGALHAHDAVHFAAQRQQALESPYRESWRPLLESLDIKIVE